MVIGDQKSRQTGQFNSLLHTSAELVKGLEHDRAPVDKLVRNIIFYGNV